MNHNSTVASVSHQLNESVLLANYVIPGETNSVYSGGGPGGFGRTRTHSARSFGGVDFNLWVVSNNIMRTHLHMGTNYRYMIWQLVSTIHAAIATRAPYYGNIAVANFVGDSGA